MNLHANLHSDLRGAARTFALLAAVACCHAALASPILLKAGTIHPESEPGGAAPRARAAAASPSAGDAIPERGLYLVQCPESVTPEWRDALEATGAKVRNYIPENAYLVDATADAYCRIESEVPHSYLGPFKAEWRLEEGVAAAATEDEQASGNGKRSSAANARSAAAVEAMVYDILLFEAADLAAVSGRISGLAGCEVMPSVGAVIRARLTADAILEIASWVEVHWIEPYVEPTINNNVAIQAPRMNVQTVWPNGASNLGLTGAGQVVAVADSGLDSGNMSTIHEDVRGRIVSAYSIGRMNDDGRWDDPGGHGTHVVGSVLGNGAKSNGTIKGVAYEASLVFQSLCMPTNLWTRDVYGGWHYSLWSYSDLRYLFLETYTNQNGRAGARIHSNSWGYSTESEDGHVIDVKGKYRTGCHGVDAFMFDNPDMIIVWAAGNDGIDADKDGIIDAESLDVPATAKNCITVGASENYRTSGGYSPYRWGDAWQDCFPANPIKTDYISRPSSGGNQGIAAFSSRGPCVDGRIKPDIVAPGTDILSMKSCIGFAETWGGYDKYYHFMGGTSMATPLVSGSAALVRQWLQRDVGVPNPDGATIKAVLLAGAKSLSPGQYGTVQYREIPASYPNNVEGWGQANVGNAVTNVNGIVVKDAQIIAQGEVKTFKFMAKAGSALVIVMAYTDAPGSPAASKALVNDLDLLVTTPSGATLYPNSRTSPDSVNNVEGVRIASAEAGVYTATVTATSIGQGMEYSLVGGFPQATRFSLVANGAREGETPIGVQGLPVAPTPGVFGTPKTLAWDSVRGANFYRVYCCANGPYGNPEPCSEWITAREFNVSAKQSDGQPLYYFVKAASEADEATASGFSAAVCVKARDTDGVYTTSAAGGSGDTGFIESALKGTIQLVGTGDAAAGDMRMIRVFESNGRLYYHRDFPDDEDENQTYSLLGSRLLKTGSSLQQFYTRTSWRWNANTAPQPRAMTYKPVAQSKSQVFGAIGYTNWFYQAGAADLKVGASVAPFGAEGGTGTIAVTNTPVFTIWTASSDKPFVTLHRTSSNGSGVLEYTVSQNDTADGRTATITFRIGGKSYATVRINQEGEVAACPPPTNLRATTDEDSGVRLSWTPNGRPEAWYRIARSLTPNIADADDSLSGLYTAAGASGWTDNRAERGVTYYYWVCAAENALDSSEWAGPVAGRRPGPTWTVDVNGVLTAVNLNGYHDVEIPSIVKSIGAGAFANGGTGGSGGDLNSADIPGTVTSIGDGAFRGCSGLLTMFIPSSVTQIGENPFADCANMTGIGVDEANPVFMAVDGVLFTKDGRRLVSYPAGRDGAAYDIPDGVADLGAGAFAGCAGLASLTFPQGVTNLGARAFQGCASLAAVTLQEGLLAIGAGAFESCAGLSGITIPRTVRRIGASAFADCDGLRHVAILGALDNYNETGTFGAGANQGTHYVTASWTGPSSRWQNWPVSQVSAATVTFNKNGGSGTMAAQIFPVGISGYSNALVRCSFSKSGYRFARWATKSSGAGTTFADGAFAAPTANMTLYAIWVSATRTLTGLEISGNDEVASGGTAQYSCRALFDDGSSETVSAVWSVVSGSEHGSIDGNGLFTAIGTDGGSVTIQAAYGGLSTPKAITVLASPPSAPVVSATGSATGVTLTWQESDRAEEYRVWRATSASGERARIEPTVSVKNESYLVDGAWVNIRVFSAIDATATPGIDYWYWVEAWNNGGAEFSAAASSWRRVSLVLPTDSVGLDYGGDDPVVIQIPANAPLSFTKEDAWLSLSAPASGEPSGVVVGATANPDMAARSATVSVTAGAGTAHPATGPFMVVQAGRPPRELSVTFGGNGARAGTMPSATFTEGVPQALPANTFTRAGFIFLGWSEDPDATGATWSDEALFTATRDTELFAVWEEDVNAASLNASLYYYWQGGTGKRAIMAAESSGASTPSYRFASNSEPILRLAIANRGDAPVVEMPAVFVCFNEEDDIVRYAPVTLWKDNPLANGKVRTRSLTLSDDGEGLPPGNYTVDVYLDPYDTLGDIDRTDNMGRCSFAILPEEPVSYNAALRSGLGFQASGTADAPFGRTFDSRSAVQFGPQNHNSQSTLSVTVNGPGKASFQWRCSCDDTPVQGASEADVFAFFVDGVRIDAITGKIDSWVAVTNDVSGDGPHTLSWTYSKDNAGDAGLDAAFLSAFAWSGEATVSTPVPVPRSWLAEMAPSILADAGGDIEAAATAEAANGRAVWECYVADLDPEDPSAELVATIVGWRDGIPEIAVLGGGSPARVYEVVGATSPSGPWGVVTDACRFFKIRVSLP